MDASPQGHVLPDQHAWQGVILIMHSFQPSTVSHMSMFSFCCRAIVLCLCPIHHCIWYRYGVSRRLFEEFLKPLLLVGLFAPAEELSAAVMIGTLYFYGEALVACGSLRACRVTVSCSDDRHSLFLW